MTDFNFVLLFVANPKASAAFYSQLLERPVAEESPTFALLPLREGVMLGLWSKAEVAPAVTATPGASEVCFAVADAAAVRATHDAWAKRGLTIAQAPTKMDFGTTFVTLDPDGHRIRVYAPEGM